MLNLLSIAAGGAIGALLRYLISGLTHQLLGSAFPWGTMCVNLSGAFIIGFLIEPFENFVIPSNYKALLLIGILGAFTTFSTFCLESFKLFQDGEIKLGLSNIFVSNISGIAFVFLGIITSRFIINLFKLGAK